MSTMQNNPVIVRSWEEISEQVLVSLSNYCESCASLERYRKQSHAGSQEVATAFEFPAFDELYDALSRDLIRAKIIVARTRNTVSSRFNSLPQEIIIKIFLAVVYSPVYSRLVVPTMEYSLHMIFLRVDKIISVCSLWRDIGLSLSTLWQFVPTVDRIYSHHRMHRTASLSLERSGKSKADNRLYLAAMLSSNSGNLTFPTPDGRAPAFHAINVQTEYLSTTSGLLRSLIQTQVPGLLSELSIYVANGNKHHDANVPENYFTHCFSDSDLSRFIELAGSLSIFRVRATNIHWDQITFSDRLVQFHLEAVALGGYSKLTGLLQTLKSAPELRTVKLKRVVCYDSPSTMSRTGIVFPKLESFYLDDLDFGVLEVIFDSVVPGSHHRTLSFTRKCSVISIAKDGYQTVDSQQVADLLKRSCINTLLLDGSFWKLQMTAPFLRTIIESLSTVTSLQLVNTGLDKKQLLALERPKSQNNSSQTMPLSFPTLVNLSIISTRIADTDALKQVVNSHRIQSMELSAKVAAIDYEGSVDSSGAWGPDYCHTFADDDKIVQWLKSNVPHFRLVDETWGARHDIQRGEWPLW